ncbi:hypothetical protein EDD15DRAFT_2444076 [Pisolithus albus]|nr:hypothetical protein EDD15DRAFT_2444076 [Pisolithus albus]
MASVHGPIQAANRSPFRIVHNVLYPQIPSSQPVSSTHLFASDQPQVYGHEHASLLCTRLFACPELPPSSSGSKVKLQKFIAYALHHTKLHPSAAFAALVLLQRLKARFPTARGSSSHRLFISAFMLASKVICDDTYSNKSWSIVEQGMFQLQEINQMEREIEFEAMVWKDFTGVGPFPTYILPSTKKSTPPAICQPFCSVQFELHTPGASLSFSSSSTSPALSAPPPTPVGVEDLSAKIISASSLPGYPSVEQHIPTLPSKKKMFAFASLAIW